MTALSDIVDVQISLQTQTVTEAGFGTLLILGNNNAFPERVRYYNSLSRVAADFSSSSPEYVAAQDVFAQNPAPNRIGIGRRQVDVTTVDVITGMVGQLYTITIDGQNYTVSSTGTATFSNVALSTDLVAGNRVNVAVNGTTLGTITSEINFSADFVASNSIVATINGAPIASVVFNTDQATTMADLASALTANAAISSATVTGPRQITSVFASTGANTINSVITTGGASQPTASISQGGFVFTTDSETTLETIRAAVAGAAGVAYATTSGTGKRILTVMGPDGVTVAVSNYTVQGGASQPTVTITNPLQPSTPDSIADLLAAYIMADTGAPVTAVSNGNGTITLTNKVTGTAYTVKASTNITSANSYIVNVTQVLPNQNYRLTLNGQNFDFLTDNLVQNADAITAGLVDLVNDPLSVVPVTATDLGNGQIRIDSDVPSSTFTVQTSPEIMNSQKGLVVLPLVASAPILDDLDAVNAASTEWYALMYTGRDQPTVVAIANWVETQTKLFGTASSDLTIVNSPAGVDVSSLAAILNQSGNTRTFVMYHQDADFDYPEAAWFGRVLPMEPGSETWMFKTLNSISYSNLTTNQINNALNKKANVYTFVGGVGITQNGTVAIGEYIDIIRGVDWLTSRIREFVFEILVRNPKIPYTDSGIAAVQAEVLRALSLGVSNNFLAEDPEPTVTVPLAASVPSADKANRILRNVTFRATLAGGIHYVVIRGTLSLV